MAINRRISSYHLPEEDVSNVIEEPKSTVITRNDDARALRDTIQSRLGEPQKPQMIGVFGINSDSLVGEAIWGLDERRFTHIPLSVYASDSRCLGIHCSTIYSPMAAALNHFFKSSRDRYWGNYYQSRNHFTDEDVRRFYYLVALMTRVENDNPEWYAEPVSLSVERVSLPEYANEVLEILNERIEGHGRDTLHKYLFEVEINPGAFSYRFLKSLQEVTSPYAFFIVRSMRTYEAEVDFLNHDAGYSSTSGSIIMQKFFGNDSIFRSEGEGEYY